MKAALERELLVNGEEEKENFRAAKESYNQRRERVK